MGNEGPRHGAEGRLFSPNDLSFLRGVIEGKSIDDVARSIGIAPGTVNAYRNGILRSYRELFPNRDPMAMAIFTALANGLIKPNEFNWGERVENLGPQEERVCSMLLMGKPDFVIASELEMQTAHVDASIRCICQKVGTDNKYGIVVFAYEKALESLSKRRH